VAEEAGEDVEQVGGGVLEEERVAGGVPADVFGVLGVLEQVDQLREGRVNVGWTKARSALGSTARVGSIQVRLTFEMNGVTSPSPCLSSPPSASGLCPSSSNSYSSPCGPLAIDRAEAVLAGLAGLDGPTCACVWASATPKPKPFTPPAIISSLSPALCAFPSASVALRSMLSEREIEALV
jgi:hypothetical protein